MVDEVPRQKIPCGSCFFFFFCGVCWLAHPALVFPPQPNSNSGVRSALVSLSPTVHNPTVSPLKVKARPQGSLSSFGSPALPHPVRRRTDVLARIFFISEMVGKTGGGSGKVTHAGTQTRESQSAVWRHPSHPGGGRGRGGFRAARWWWWWWWWYK